jgi:hypothetical protein
VDRSGKDESVVLAERRQFWSRNALLENVKVWWGIVSVLKRVLSSALMSIFRIWQPGSERTGEVSLGTANIPASDLEALQVDRVTASLSICNLEGAEVDNVPANTPIMLTAVVEVNSGEGESYARTLATSLTGLSDDIPEFKYAFEPILDASSGSTAGGTAPQQPRWKELEFLARVVAFSGPTSGLITITSSTSDAKMEGRARAAVCLFAEGVYKFRVRIWDVKGGEEWEARCSVRVRG